MSYCYSVSIGKVAAIETAITYKVGSRLLKVQFWKNSRVQTDGSFDELKSKGGSIVTNCCYVICICVESDGNNPKHCIFISATLYIIIKAIIKALMGRKYSLIISVRMATFRYYIFPVGKEALKNLVVVPIIPFHLFRIDIQMVL